MSHVSPRELDSFIPAALAASNVGTWDYDAVNDRLWYDRTTASLFGLPHQAGRSGRLGLEAPVSTMHPDDRALFAAKHDYVLKHGGLYVAEYRTVPRPGDIRRLLARGRYETDTSGRVARGRGIVIDVTESEQSGYVGGDAVFLTDRQNAGTTALDRIADHLLAMHRELNGLAEGDDLKVLWPLVRALLFKVGRLLAKRLRASSLH